MLLAIVMVATMLSSVALAAEKGISLSAERIRVALEEAVGNLKQAFQNEVAA